MTCPPRCRSSSIFTSVISARSRIILDGAAGKEGATGAGAAGAVAGAGVPGAVAGPVAGPVAGAVAWAVAETSAGTDFSALKIAIPVVAIIAGLVILKRSRMKE